MASAIKPIEAKSIHQIQSGQVIVDLCSVVKELVENALDADASTIEVRFKNNGLDSIEVQDNGTGISEANYEHLALKHYTSKLSTYEDLSNVQTFGFRGEALSSLCALSHFSVITSQAHEAPRGSRLEFESSGRLKSTTLTAAQKGTTVVVENLFANLPVRQKELTKNVKREYGKVIGLLHAYACISTHIKLTVKNTMPKARSSVVFSTKGNSTTRDNIANVYGAKMLSQLIELDLKLDLPPTATQAGQDEDEHLAVVVSGHISKPVFGEGRQTPDRQLFFVNGRPCGLPQIAKAINEVYRSYNVTQSPFICADFQMDTSAYDVNVSPDKRTILLHNAVALTDQLKIALTERFDNTEQTVPQSQVQMVTLPPYRQLTMSKPLSKEGEAIQDLPHSRSSDLNVHVVAPDTGGADDSPETESQEAGTPRDLLKQHFGNIASTREEPELDRYPDPKKVQALRQRQAEKVKESMEKHDQSSTDSGEIHEVRNLPDKNCSSVSSAEIESPDIPVRDFTTQMSEQGVQPQSDIITLDKVRNHTCRQRREEEVGVVTNAFDRMRPRRPSPEIATITIGDRVITRLIGTPRSQQSTLSESSNFPPSRPQTQFSQSLQKFDLRDGLVQRPVEHDPSSDTEHDGEGSAEHEEVAEQHSTHHRSNVSDEPGRTSYEDSGSGKAGEEDERAAEERRVKELIRAAEASVAANGKGGPRRSAQTLKGSILRDATVDQCATLDVDLDFLAAQAKDLTKASRTAKQNRQLRMKRQDSVKGNEEERLSLTISKADFARMHIAGQFNLGFIIAVRPKDEEDTARGVDELFIIDQHASDEKYNFERLQSETIVGNQRLVHAVVLDLTAVEEEIVLENEAALQQNGFIIDADQSGELPIGQRCKLLSLPLSKEVTFNMKDLEELIHLLSDSHISANSTYVPRPSKVRKMFAMRACRSSIMIGKTLSRRQMKEVIDHMGGLDKPWNCPHGRPTMRHLTSLDKVDKELWNEGDGLSSDDSNGFGRSNADIWKSYIE